MNISALDKTLSIIFLLLVSMFLVYKAVERPRVLVLHSYATDFSWVKDINTGIDRALGDRPYNIRHFYMDTKKHPSLEFRREAGSAARDLIHQWKPSVILAVDDNAQEFVGRYFVNHPDIDIVYAGVNADLARYDYHQADNVGGIGEVIPWAVTKEVLASLGNEENRLLHLSDDSDTSHYVHDSIQGFDWQPFKLVGSKNIDDFDAWKAAVVESNTKADWLLITHYHTIKDPQDPNKVVNPATVVEWTKEHSDLPMLGFWRFFIEDGGMMAVGLSPFEQGEEAGHMVTDIIEKGLQAGSIGHKQNRLYLMYIRKTDFHKRLKGKEIPLEIEAFADAVDGAYD
ncbi:hypothetical protein F2Q65_11825 [Thiohalocapsa marina]|uniref:Sugar ABC transporter n=1 Tax=Thiohalocapsa marina TaxID=424902 RepID=A0A5M8FL87_9GAMM|nr:hypothetical protein [Thiohalocapsa marina]KAA6184526.1 hypothetical protein F2Q65_11825 [Thiohalocapsa marina]